MCLYSIAVWRRDSRDTLLVSVRYTLRVELFLEIDKILHPNVRLAMFSLGAFCHPYWVFWIIQHQCAVDAIDEGEQVSYARASNSVAADSTRELLGLCFLHM